jgi:hypothetical protein
MIFDELSHWLNSNQPHFSVTQPLQKTLKVLKALIE